MYDHRNADHPAELTRQGLYFETEPDYGRMAPVHDMLSLSANPELTPDMPSSLFHMQPVASRGSLGSLSRSRR